MLIFSHKMSKKIITVSQKFSKKYRYYAIKSVSIIIIYSVFIDYNKNYLVLWTVFIFHSTLSS